MSAFLLPLTAEELDVIGGALVDFHACEAPETRDALLERLAELFQLTGQGEEWCRFVGIGRARGRRQG